MDYGYPAFFCKNFPNHFWYCNKVIYGGLRFRQTLSVFREICKEKIFFGRIFSEKNHGNKIIVYSSMNKLLGN